MSMIDFEDYHAIRSVLDAADKRLRYLKSRSKKNQKLVPERLQLEDAMIRVCNLLLLDPSGVKS